MDATAISNYIKPFSINKIWKSLLKSHEIIHYHERYAIRNNELIQFNTNTGLISLTTRPP